jgi:hypothetical protein
MPMESIAEKTVSSTEKVEVTIRDKVLTGIVTNDDAFFFMSFYYNDKEKELSAQGKDNEAASHLSDRLNERMKRTGNSKKENEAFITEMATKIRREIAHDWNVRKNVCWRLIECFPDIPDNLVFWESEKKFGIRLNVDELILLFMSVIAIVFTNFLEKQSKTDKGNESPTVELKKATIDKQEQIDKLLEEEDGVAEVAEVDLPDAGSDKKPSIDARSDVDSEDVEVAIPKSTVVESVPPIEHREIAKDAAHEIAELKAEIEQLKKNKS